MLNLKEQIRQLEGPIAIFGGSGFIGANLIRTLLEVRKDCYAVTHQSFLPWRLVGVPTENVLHCDICSPLDVEKLFQRFPFRTLFCFAAYGAYSRQADASTIYKTNVLGLLHILTAAKQRGFAALVHAGSSSEYGTNCAAPSENDALLPNSHYAASKVSASYLLQYEGANQKLPVINLRFYSAYGPWEEPDRLIPQLLEKALQGTLPPLVAPDISRDFIFVDDAVSASIAAAYYGVKTHPGASLNIGTGKKTTISELVELSRAEFDVKEKPQWGSMGNRRWDLADWYANPELAQKVLHWKASTTLAQGLQLTAKWVKQNMNAPQERVLAAPQKLIRLSAVIACYRDAQAIPLMHERLTKVFREMKVDYEIIFVNDGSPDNTDEVLTALCASDPHVLAIEHSRNFGSQNAFLDGMALSTGDGVILLDGDLQDPPELIPQFYAQWRAGFEVVYGRRVRREAKMIMQFCYKAFYRVLQKLAYVPIPVDAGDFSLMDRKVVDRLLEFRETDQFLRGLRAWVGFKQTGVDYVRPERVFGTTTNNWRKNFWWARKAIFSFSFAPMEMLMYGGFALTGLSFAGLITQILVRLLDPSIPHGIATLIVLILFFGGINMLGLSILGEYIGKVFEESKARPKFIRRSIRQGSTLIHSSSAMDKFVQGRRECVGT